MAVKIDNINKKILYLVQKDARISYKEIAKILNRSETTIRDRIKSMEEAGIIQGYTALIDKTALGLNFFAMILANPNSLLDLDEVTEKIKNVKNVSRVYQISGEYKIAIFMVATSYKELKENLKKYILPLGEAVINLLDDKHCLNRAR